MDAKSFLPVSWEERINNKKSRLCQMRRNTEGDRLACLDPWIFFIWNIHDDVS